MVELGIVDSVSYKMVGSVLKKRVKTLEGERMSNSSWIWWWFYCKYGAGFRCL